MRAGAAGGPDRWLDKHLTADDSRQESPNTKKSA